MQHRHHKRGVSSVRRRVAKRRVPLLFRRVRPIGCHGGPWILMESVQALHAGFGAGIIRTPRRRCRCRYLRNTRVKVSAPIEATVTASKFTSRNRVVFEVSGSTSAGSVAGPAATAWKFGVSSLLREKKNGVSSVFPGKKNGHLITVCDNATSTPQTW